jgi:uncharacterized protein (DUF342 family)
MAEMAGFVLTEDAETHKLIAHFEPAEGRMPPDSAFVRQFIADQGLEDCFIDDHAITAFTVKCREVSQAEGQVAPVDVAIGERRDGYVEVSLSDNRMSAWLTLIPAKGGKSTAVAEINGAIASKGVVHGLKGDVLSQAILSGDCNAVLIAEGTEPTPGVVAKFESQLDALLAHDASDYDKVDYRDLGDLLLVDPGTPLLKRIPAIQGVDGMDVCGRVVPVKPVPDAGFAKGLSGVNVSADDANMLVAVISGQPKVQSNGATVNPVIDIQHIDLETGNIEFDGTVKVKGDIKSGMSVRVSGDVVVQGTVESAEIVAGGDVVVKGGIVGRADSSTTNVESARITCNGSLEALFVEHVRVMAGKDITIHTAARQSELYAGQEILVGKAGSSQGQLVGGQARALLKIKAAVLGAPSGTPTVVQVGFDPRMNTERLAIEQNRKRRLEEYARIKQLLTFIEQHPSKGEGGVKEKAMKTREQIDIDLENMEARLAEINDQLELVDGASIEVGKQIYGGVNLQVGNKLMHVLDERMGGKIRLVDDEILIS